MTTNRKTFLQITSWAPLFTLAMVILFWGVHTGITSSPLHFEIGTGEEIMQGRTHAEGSPAAVLAEHSGSCWRGNDEAKADLPAAAIVQKVGGEAVYTKRPALVDAAFQEALSAAGYGSFDDPSIKVIALCI